jgi:16S rRNA A1518/A1519 N6-dimethyltransferase RsmA/KsgA/DIM1 with predicted DNA glycosylase/AP lyase activity
MKNKTWSYIDWRKVWKEMRKMRIRLLRIRYDKDFQKHFLTDQFAKDQTNNYEYGRKAVKSLAGLLSPDSEVLEIGSGPGTLTIPLAEKVKMIKAMEISPKMVTGLRKVLKDKQINNVEIIEKD